MAENGNKAGQKAIEPLLAVECVTFKNLKAPIKVETHALLLRYVAFYQKVKSQKVSEGQLVNAALERAFQQDVAFNDFLKSSSGAGAATPRVAAIVAGDEKGGGSDHKTTG